MSGQYKAKWKIKAALVFSVIFGAIGAVAMYDYHENQERMLTKLNSGDIAPLDTAGSAPERLGLTEKPSETKSSLAQETPVAAVEPPDVVVPKLSDEDKAVFGSYSETLRWFNEVDEMYHTNGASAFGDLVKTSMKDEQLSKEEYALIKSSYLTLKERDAEQQLVKIGKRNY